MDTKTKPRQWYEAKTGNHQGLIIDENDGRNVAVAYDKADAPLLAAAPELLEILGRAEEVLLDDPDFHLSQLKRDIRAAIRKAEGRE